MNILEVRDYSFCYGDSTSPALSHLTMTVEEGSFSMICGASGCGKSTLLSQIKQCVSYEGKHSGEIFFFGQSVDSLSPVQSASEIAMVFQNPQRQMVCHNVWHELAFSLENLGVPQKEMRLRIGEMVSFFGLESLLYKRTDELSGGQMQIIALASALLLRPKLLLLDEPTSQLDPISREEFLQFLLRINREQGTTIIIAEQETAPIFPFCDRVFWMAQGQLLGQGAPQDVAGQMYLSGSKYLPDVTRLCFMSGDHQGIFSLPDGKKFIAHHTFSCSPLPEVPSPTHTILQTKGLCFTYEKGADYVLDDLDLAVMQGEILCLLGGNGSGKSTLLKILANTLTATKGKIICNQSVKIAYLAQNHMLYFKTNSLKEEFSACQHGDVALAYAKRFGIDDLLDSHPYDISAGQSQMAALSIVLSRGFDILLLDEPTKGLDPTSQEKLIGIIQQLQQEGKTIVIATHHMTFAAQVCHRVCLMFDKEIVGISQKQGFFAENFFYTTQICKLFSESFPLPPLLFSQVSPAQEDL